MKINWKLLIVAIVLCQLAGVFGSIFTIQSVSTWYSTIERPSFSPPNWLFGPAWITLYTLMGISLYLVWQKKKNYLAVRYFYLQLIFNAIWSFLFFGLRNPALALFELIFLILLVFGTIVKFYYLDKRAAYLMYPYLAWILFASILNFNLMLLN